jgi:hypothetical protein
MSFLTLSPTASVRDFAAIARPGRAPDSLEAALREEFGDDLTAAILDIASEHWKALSYELAAEALHRIVSQVAKNPAGAGLAHALGLTIGKSLTEVGAEAGGVSKQAIQQSADRFRKFIQPGTPAQKKPVSRAPRRGMLDLAQAALVGGVLRQSIHRGIREGKLRFACGVTDAGSLSDVPYFDRADVLAFVASRTPEEIAADSVVNRRHKTDRPHRMPREIVDEVRHVFQPSTELCRAG